MTPPVHPIEAESYRILAGRVNLSHLPPGPRAVVARMIHASADLDYATATVVDEAAVAAGVAALRAGAPVIADVEMVRHGLSVDAHCLLREVGPTAADEDPELTRSARAMRLAAHRFASGAVVVVGCAPTALVEVLRLAREDGFAPALVVGLPVGFVGAAEAKAAARESGLVTITNVGEKGGSTVAAAALNALVRLARAEPAAEPAAGPPAPATDRAAGTPGGGE